MPDFPDNPLENLAILTGDADQQIDLGDLSPDAALEKVQALLRSAPSGTSYVVMFDPPADDGSETPFQLLGRFLLKARRDGRLVRCLPNPKGNGFFISTPAA